MVKERPAVLAGKKVGGWITHADAAEVFGVDVRTLERWEKKGFPAAGAGHKKKHPMPHALAWAIALHARELQGDVVEWLPVALALQEYAAARAAEAARWSGELRVRRRGD